MVLIDQKILKITPTCECNGCGSKRTDLLFPDKFGRVDFTMACNIHDAHYYALTNAVAMKSLYATEWVIWRKLADGGREYADKTFKANMIRLNQAHGSIFLRPIIEAYWLGVRLFGSFCIKK
jgi:hypothetical protein